MENMQKSHAIQPIDGNDPPDVGLIETAGEERDGKMLWCYISQRNSRKN